MRDDFSQVGITLRFPEGLPNLASLDSIRITDTSVIVRAAAPAGRLEAEMVQRRWSWAGPSGKPVYNFRSEGREFRNSATGGRCLIPLDGFYEFTEPGTVADRAGAGKDAGDAGGAGEQPYLLGAAPAPAAPPRKGARPRKDKWLFTLAEPEAGLFCVAGLWRADAKFGEAFTMLTGAPGPDIAPYHSRQIVLMPRDRWAAWLDDANPAGSLIEPTPAGTLRVERAR
ncbi:SOS response-associated peptidase family protein [Glacieibacterium sp.]|uniref:SOS response-associated peptidase family protein n=1 Tax=Glacieibacterium sp. TaxID=2860237 RepID=UPI003B00A1D3